jgi:hypothetical protein
MARKNVLSAFDTLDPDTEALDPNLFSSPSLLNNASPTAPNSADRGDIAKGGCSAPAGRCPQ